MVDDARAFDLLVSRLVAKTLIAFDLAGDGRVDAREAAHFIKAFYGKAGKYVPKEQLDEYFAKLDVSQQGWLGSDELYQFYTGFCQPLLEFTDAVELENELGRLFELQEFVNRLVDKTMLCFDIDKKGVVDYAGGIRFLKAFYGMSGKQYDEDIVVDYFNSLDTDKNGKIDKHSLNHFYMNFCVPLLEFSSIEELEDELGKIFTEAQANAAELDHFIERLVSKTVNVFDVNKNGVIEAKEGALFIKSFYGKVGEKVPDTAIDQFVEFLDSNKNGMVDKQELAGFYKSVCKPLLEFADVKEVEHNMSKVFELQEFVNRLVNKTMKKYDKEGHGLIDTKEGAAFIERFYCKSGMEYPEGAVKDFLSKLDPNGKGMIDREALNEFYMNFSVPLLEFSDIVDLEAELNQLFE